LWYANSELLLRLMPAGINLVCAAYFAFGLSNPPALPTRMAALHHRVAPGDLPAPLVRYTTGVTRVWVGFFILNAAVSAIVALIGSREIWALYNGLIAYLAVAGLFAAEYAYRRLVFYKNNLL